MPTESHEDHVLWKPRVLPRRTRMLYAVCVVATIGMIAVGWILTLKGVVTESFAQAKSEFSTATQVFDDVRSATSSVPRTPVEDLKSQFRDVLKPYVEAAEDRKDTFDAAITITKDQLTSPPEESPSPNPENPETLPYGETEPTE